MGGDFKVESLRTIVESHGRLKRLLFSMAPGVETNIVPTSHRRVLRHERVRTIAQRAHTRLRYLFTLKREHALDASHTRIVLSSDADPRRRGLTIYHLHNLWQESSLLDYA